MRIFYKYIKICLVASDFARLAIIKYEYQILMPLFSRRSGKTWVRKPFCIDHQDHRFGLGTYLKRYSFPDYENLLHPSNSSCSTYNIRDDDWKDDSFSLAINNVKICTNNDCRNILAL